MKQKKYGFSKRNQSNTIYPQRSDAATQQRSDKACPCLALVVPLSCPCLNLTKKSLCQKERKKDQGKASSSPL